MKRNMLCGQPWAHERYMIFADIVPLTTNNLYRHYLKIGWPIEIGKEYVSKTDQTVSIQGTASSIPTFIKKSMPQQVSSIQQGHSLVCLGK